MKKITFEPVDPLGDGLREAIDAEKSDQNAIELDDWNEAGPLAAVWQQIVSDVKNDPEWFDFASENDCANSDSAKKIIV